MMTREEILKVIKETEESGAEVLDLVGKGITELPAAIERLTNLKTLYLSGNRLSSLPPEIGQLVKLEELYLTDNQLSVLPPEIGNLINLDIVDLSVNNLTALPPEFAKLHNLSILGISFNKFTEFPLELTHLPNLKGLLFRSNHLSVLPMEVRRLTRLRALRLQGNPLPVPPEILDSEEPSQIINYFFQHQAGQKRPLNEAKVLVLGQRSVGKTSLVKALMGEQFNPHEGKTEGIDIQRWPVRVGGHEVRLNVWDFGGQEIMHATHQFFLTKRSLYVLVLDARVGEEENRVEYWLKIIQSFGKDSPVIVVGNKVDQQGLDVNRASLQQKYPNIRAFVETSCRTGAGVNELKNLVVREIGRLEHIHDPLLVSWFAVKERLEGMKEDYIPYHEYVRLCQAEKIDDEQSQSTLIGFLHDLGIVLNFRDDPRLEETNILNPEWVTNGVYKILNSHMLFQSRGVLERKALSKILDPRKYPKDKHLFIMDMMRKFELCFDFEGMRDERFLVPDLLTRDEPDTGDWRGALAFQYHYSVLPSSIISRFIVRMHQHISKTTLWRTGVVLVNNGNKALVKADLEDRKIFIWVGGPEESRRRFLEVIRSHFDSIHKTIPGIVADEKVPLPERPDIAVDYKHLLRLEREGIPRWIPEGLVESIDVKRLLDGVETEQARRERHDARLLDERPERLQRKIMPEPPAAPAAVGEDAAALEELTRIKNKLDSGSESFAKRCFYAYIALMAAGGCVLCLLIYRLGWDKMEPWTYGVGIVAFIGNLIIAVLFAVKLKDASPRAIYEHIIERKKLKSYQSAGFDLKKYERLAGIQARE